MKRIREYPADGNSVEPMSDGVSDVKPVGSQTILERFRKWWKRNALIPARYDFPFDASLSHRLDNCFRLSMPHRLMIRTAMG